MKVPVYVLNPDRTEECYIRIEEVEPGSELAHRVVEAELKGKATGSVREAMRRVRRIAKYLRVPFSLP
jgi:hypothetical protein